MARGKLRIYLGAAPGVGKTVAMLAEGDSVGVFQVESRAQMGTLPRLKPRCFFDLVVEVAQRLGRGLDHAVGEGLDGLLALAGAVTGRPAATGGRTLENLGLADLDRSGMQALLHDGPAQ